ncbi:hypothetical protein CLU79DRAFT_369280 [Phycomyces nitens]|nr:hypothetical protein CLU79DRAFT_369280 [Phycomyces nitens]
MRRLIYQQQFKRERNSIVFNSNLTLLVVALQGMNCCTHPHTPIHPVSTFHFNSDSHHDIPTSFLISCVCVFFWQATIISWTRIYLNMLLDVVLLWIYVSCTYIYIYLYLS